MPSSARRLSQRSVRVLRRAGLSGVSNRVNLATVIAIAVGALLIALQAALAGLWLATVGILLLGVAVTVIATKAHKGAIFAARTNRQLRRRARAGGSTAAPSLAVTARPQDSGQPIDKLHSIGMVTPEVADTAAKGRQAAAVKDDPDRSFRLYAATLGAAASSHDPLTDNGPRLAVVATSALADWLDEEFTITRLHPGLARAEFEASQPRALVIQEDALREGSWYSTLQASGVRLLRELFDLIYLCRERGIMVYAVASDSLELSTTSLRRRVSMVVYPGVDGALAADQLHGSEVQRPVIDRLQVMPNHSQAGRSSQRWDAAS